MMSMKMKTTVVAKVLLTAIFIFLSISSPTAQAAAAGTRTHGVYSSSTSTSLQRPMSMMSPFGRRRGYRRRRRRRSSYRRPASARMPIDYSKCFLDDKNWLTDKKIRIWDGQSNARKRPNQIVSWSGRLTFANIVCYAIQSYNPRFTQWGVKLSERILAGQDLYRLITPVFLHGGIYQ